jgi:hypothetical protein
MRKKWLLFLVGLSLLVIVMSACSVPITQSSLPAAAGNVTFVIPIEVDNFSKDATLSVRLWNAEQLAYAEENAPCAVSYDAQTGIEAIHCPEGVEYHEAMPEELAIPISNVDTNITVTSTSIRVGEKYRVQISGLSNDDCNSTSASIDGTANSQTITLENLAWMTTMMACLGE